MIARLYAMYQQSRKMLIFLVVVDLAVTIGCVILGIMSRGYDFGGRLWPLPWQCTMLMERLPEEVVISDIIHMCIALDTNFVNFEGITSTWILGFVWEVISLCLAIRIAVMHLKELQRTSTGWTVGDCFRVLVKTHVLYFTWWGCILDIVAFSDIGCMLALFLLHVSPLPCCLQRSMYVDRWPHLTNSHHLYSQSLRDPALILAFLKSP